MLDFCQHAPLVVGVLHLLHLDDLRLLQYLDSVESLIVLGLDHVHATKTSGTERAFEVKVLQMVFAFCRLLVPLHWPRSIGHLVYARLGGIRRRGGLRKGRLDLTQSTFG